MFLYFTLHTTVVTGTIQKNRNYYLFKKKINLTWNFFLPLKLEKYKLRQIQLRIHGQYAGSKVENGVVGCFVVVDYFVILVLVVQGSGNVPLQ